jgi:hypothetical protein
LATNFFFLFIYFQFLRHQRRKTGTTVVPFSEKTFVENTISVRWLRFFFFYLFIWFISFHLVVDSNENPHQLLGPSATEKKCLSFGHWPISYMYP